MILDRIRVLDLTTGLAGPMAGMLLADHGADVVKVEPPGGDWARSEPGFAMWNRGKQSIALDLRAAADRSIVRRMIVTSDVVLESFRAGTASRLGVDHADTAALNPAAIHCSITGFGPLGELARTKAYEGIVSAKAGLWNNLDDILGAVHDHGQRGPIYKAATINCYAAAQLAMQAVLAGLYARRRDGRGQHVRTSLLQGASAMVMRTSFRRIGEAGVDDDPIGRRAGDVVHRGIRMCFITAECADGRWIQMCARQDVHFRNWMAALDLSAVFDEPRFAKAPLGIATVADIDELEDRIRDRMRTRTQADWMEAFQRLDVGADPFLDPAEYFAHPQVVANDRVLIGRTPDGENVVQPGPLVLFDDTPVRINARSPRLDEHGASIRATVVEPRPAPPGWLTAGVPIYATVPSPRYPLAGVTLIELAYFLAAPLAGSLLAELGARVIKVEPLDGDPFRRVGTQATPMLHGKESLAVDLKDPRGREILTNLIARADVFYTSFRTRSHERLGIDYPRVHAVNPRAVYLFAASYGSRGPWKDRAAFHSTPNALCGAGILQAGEGNPPVDDSWPDPVSGLAAASAILLGLTAREQTGRGQYIETSMISSSAHAFSREMLAYLQAGDWASVPDREQQGRTATERIYPCRTGRLYVEVHSDAEWQALVGVLGKPAWAGARFSSASGRSAADAELRDLLGDELRGRDAADWEMDCREHGVPAVQISESSYERFMLAHGQLIPAAHPVLGDYWRQPPSYEFSGSATRSGAAASIGEHTRSILTELGYDHDTVDALNAAAVIREA